MMNKIKIPLILVLVLLISSSTQAQLFRSTTKVGTTAAQFLKIGAGAKAIGMGNAHTAVGGDIYSIYWNPAGLAEITGSSEFAFNHAEWLADVKYDFAAAALNMGEFGVISASFTSLSVPEDKVRTIAAPEGDGRTWDAGSVAITIGFSKSLTDRFSVGVQTKYIRESVWNTSASGFAVDLGTLYRTPFNDLIIGASISNFGTQMRLDGRDLRFNYDPDDNFNTGPNNVPSVLMTDEFDLPLTFRIGLAMDLIQNRFFKVTAAVDATHPNDNTEYVNSGVELSYDDLLFFRAGYKSLFKDNSEEGLTLGGGIKYSIGSNMRVYFNYGYADYGKLENVQFIDVGLGF
jgi:opacity protein-like surface antigen